MLVGIYISKEEDRKYIGINNNVEVILNEHVIGWNITPIHYIRGR
jgi:hypothetical protein